MNAGYSKSVYYNIRLTSRYIKAFIAQILEEFNVGISNDELFTLDILRCEGSMCQRDMAKFLFKDRANTGKIAQSLEKKGLITIDIDYKDKRLVKKLTITEEGLDLLNRLNETSKSVLDKITEKFSEEEHTDLINILKKIASEIKPVLKTQI